MKTPDSMPLEFDDKHRAIALPGAEKLLLEAVKAGEEAEIPEASDPMRAEGWGDEHAVRADFLRHICLHPDLYQVDPWGVRIKGGSIAGVLNFNSCTLVNPLKFEKCRFDSQPDFEDANTRFLAFDGCYLPGFWANSIVVSNSLWLTECMIEGEVSLVGATIKDNLVCGSTKFISPQIPIGELPLESSEPFSVLDGRGIKIGGDLDLGSIRTYGETSFTGANIAGDMDCRDAEFICSDLNPITSNQNNDALLVQHMIVKGRLFLTEMSPIIGHLDLRDSQIEGGLIDDGTGWPAPGKLWLDCFSYTSLDDVGKKIDRKNWLSLMPTDREGVPVYWPQPYEQLIKVYRNSGHEDEAREVAIAKRNAFVMYVRAQVEKANSIDDKLFMGGLLPKEKTHLKALRSQLPTSIKWPLFAWFWFFKVTAGYGYKPRWALYWLAGFFALGILFFAGFNDHGLMEPAKERVYTDACYVNKLVNATKPADFAKPIDVKKSDDNNKPTQPDCLHWLEIKHTGQNGDKRYLPPDYPEFNALVYSLDVLLPIVDLKLEDHWVPSSRIMLDLGRVYLWIHIIMGWVFSTIAVAGFSGVLKKD